LGNESFEIKGTLETPAPAEDVTAYTAAALEQRPDLQARKAAITEAQARLRLQVADRYGNPSIGPAFEYNETRVTFAGMWLVTPIPVLNTRKGEILLAQANLARAQADVHQVEVQTGQDVSAAVARVAEARKWANSYTAEVIPHLHQAVKDMDKLFDQNEAGVDLLKVIGVQRTYLRAFDTYLDALFELSQARGDLAAAVADPALAVGTPPPSPAPKATAPRPGLPAEKKPNTPPAEKNPEASAPAEKKPDAPPAEKNPEASATAEKKPGAAPAKDKP
jgi:outer membrane protein TolC